MRVESRDPGKGDATWTLHPEAPLPGDSDVLLCFSYDLEGTAAPLFYVGPEIAFASAWGTDWYPLPDGQSKGVGTLRIVCPGTWSAVAGAPGVSSSPPSPVPSPAAVASFTFAIEHPTFFSFVAGPFSVETRDGSPRVSAYVLGPHEHLHDLLEGSQRLLDVLSDEFGPLPTSGFSLVEIPRDIAGRSGFNAASLPGAIWLNGNAFGAPKIDFMLEWLGHEFSHQWFPQTVALRTPPGLYMEEAIAEFGGWHAVEVLAGAKAAERLRRTGFEFDPIYSAAAYFKLVAAGHDRPLSHLESGLDDRNVAYTKGAFVFSMLERTVGPLALREAFHRVVMRHRFEEIGWRDFLTAIEASTGKDLRWFYDEWFERRGAPDVTLSWTQRSNQLDLVLHQTAPAYRMTLEVELSGDGGRHETRTVEAAASAETTATLPVDFAVQGVVLDPSYEVLRVVHDEGATHG